MIKLIIFDVGGVLLNIKTPDELIRSHDRFMDATRAKLPKARIMGVHVQEMAEKGKEVFLGMKQDPHFGPILLFGLGGIYVEALRDVSFRVAPIREFGAERMMEGIRSYPILKGLRGEKPVDFKILAECILRLSQLSVELDGIEELDINPLMVYSTGKGARICDARIILKPL